MAKGGNKKNNENNSDQEEGVLGLGIDPSKAPKRLQTDPAVTSGYDLGEFKDHTEGPINVLNQDPYEERAEAQGAFEQLGTAALNLGPNVVLGTLQNAGHLYEMAASGFGAWDDMSFGNDFTEAMKEARNYGGWGDIHVGDPNSTFDADDMGSYIKFGSNIAESVGEFYLTGAGLGSALGKGASALSRAAKFGPKASKTAQGGSQLLTSFGLAGVEAGMSAERVKDQSYREYRAQGMSHEEATSKAQSDANTTFWWSAIPVTALNLGSVGPLFKSNRAIRKAERQGLSIGENQSTASYAKQLDEVIEDPRIKKRLTKKYGIGIESLKEGLEENANLFAEQLGKKDGDFKDYIDANLGTEGILATIGGMAGGAGQQFMMRRGKFHKSLMKDEKGNPMTDSEGNFMYKRKSAKEIEEQDDLSERVNIAQSLREDLKDIDDANKRIRDGVQEGDDSKIEKAKRDLFSITARRSVANGTADNLKRTYEEIEALDNNEVDENGETEAMKKGVAESPTDNEYKKKAREAREDIDKATEMYNRTMSQLNYQDEQATGYAGALFQQRLKRYLLGKEKDRLEKEKQEIEKELNRINTEDVSLQYARDLLSRSRQLEESRNELFKDLRKLEGYRKTSKKDRTKEQEQEINKLKSKYQTKTLNGLESSIKDALEDSEAKQKELDKEISTLKEGDPNIEEKVKRVAKGDHDLDRVNKQIEDANNEIRVVNNYLERLNSSKGKEEFLKNVEQTGEEERQRQKDLREQQEKTRVESIQKDLENTFDPKRLREKVASYKEVDEQSTEKALQNIKKDQKKEAPLFSKEDPISRYEGRPVLFTEEMEEIRSVAQNALDNGTISQEEFDLIDNNLDDLSSFGNLVENQYTEGIGAVLDEYFEAKNNAEEETSNPTEDDDTADPEGPTEQDPGDESEHPPTEDDDRSIDIQGSEGFVSNFSTYEFQKDEGGTIIRDERGKPKFKRDENGELVFNPLAKAIGTNRQDLEYRDNPQGLQKGDKIYYEVNANLLRNEYHQKLGNIDSQEFLNKFLIQAVTYDSEGNRRVVGALPIYDPKGKDPHNFSSILETRKKILSEYKNRDTSNVIFRSSISTQVQEKRAGHFKTVPGARQDPRDVLVKPDGSGSYDFHIGIARVDNSGSIWIDANGHADKIDTNRVEPGKAYLAATASNGNRIPAKLRIRNLRDQHDFIKDKYGEKRSSLLEEAVPLISGINKSNHDKTIAQLNDLFMADAEFVNGKLQLYTGDYMTRDANKKAGKPNIVIDPSQEDTESIESKIEGLASKVDVNKINKDNYNDQIADEGRVYSDLRPGIHTHSSTFTVKTLAAETTQEESTTIEEQEGNRQPDEESETAEQEFDEKQKEEAPLPSREEETKKTVRDPRSAKPADDRKIKTSGTSKKGKVKWKNRSKGDDEVYNPFKDPNYKEWNKEEEISWLNRNFPQLTHQVLDGLIEVNKNGGEYAFGMFQNGIIQLSEHAEAGTAYHEAFHAVFRMFNTYKQQRDLLNEAKKRYKTPTEEDLNNLSSHKEGLSREELTELYYEEKMAEEFQEYKLAGDDISLSQRIKNFFKKIFDYIKSIFTSDVNIHQLFRRMDNEYYRDKEPFRRDLSRLGGAAFNVAHNMSYREMEDRTTLINDEFFEVIEYLKNEEPFYKELKDTQIINSLASDKRMGIDEVYLEVYSRINEQVRETLTEEAKEGGATQEEVNEINEKIDKVLNSFIELDENGDIAKRNDLYYSAVRDLKDHGINVSFKKGGNAEVTEATTETKLENEVEENIDRREQWQVDRVSTSLKETIGQRIKRTLKTIKNPNDIDDLGLERNIDFDEIFNYLKRELSGVPTTNDIIPRLEQLRSYKPGIDQLIETLKENPQLASQFKSQFNNTHTKHLNIFENQNNEFKTAFANQNSIHNIIQNDWKNAMNRSKIKNRDGSINTQLANELEERFRAEYNKLKRAEDIKQSDLREISRILKDMGIQMDPENLYDAYRKGRIPGTNIGEKGANPYSNLASILTGEHGSIASIINLLKNGKDPFAGEGFNTLNKLSRLKALRENDLFESSFLGPNNKRIHAHLAPTNLSIFVDTIKNDPDKRKALIEEFRKDPFYYKSPWLRDLEEDETASDFDYAMFSEFKPRDRGRGSEYERLSSSELLAVQINAWYNNGFQKAYYMAPIQSDRPNAYFLKHRKYKSIDAVVDDLYQVALQEKARIDGNFKPRDEEGNEYEIANFEENKKKHMLLPFLNDYKEDITEDPSAVKEHIRNKIEEEFETFYANQVEGKIDDYIDSNLKNNKGEINKNDIKLFYFSSYLANTQIGTLLSGDPAFFKSKDDLYKRIGMATAPGTFMDIGAKYGDTQVNSTRSVVYMEDSELGEDESISEEVRDGLINNGFSKEFANEIAGHYGIDEAVNETDAQTFITLEEYKKVMVGLGRWNENLERAYERAKQGKAVGSDIDLIFQTIKPVNTGFKKVGKKMIPFQHKNSEAVLLPQLVEDETGVKSTKLKNMLDWMESNNIDAIHFESAVKAGQFATASLSDPDEGNTPYIHTIPRRTMRLQQETPVHGEEENIVYSTQMRRIVTSDLSTEFSIDSLNAKGADEVKNAYQNLISANIREKFDELRSQFSDIYKARDILLSEVEDEPYSDELRKALKIVYDNEGKERFNIELYHPIHSNRTEQLINSIFKGRVNRQMINGEQLIQQSSIGFRDDLQIHFQKDENGKISSISHVDVYLPWKYKSLFKPETEDGKVDDSLISEEARKLIAHTMPFEDKYSALPLRIKGFLPEGSGQAILLPSEVTTIMGTDFDIDKLYTQMPNLKKRIDFGNAEKVLREEGFNYNASKIREIMDSKNEDLDSREVSAKDTLNEILKDHEESKKNGLYTIDIAKYDESRSVEENTKEQRDNKLIEITHDILTHPESFDKVMNPGNFEKLKDLESQVREKKAGEGTDTGIFSPNTQLDMFDRVRTGASLVGLVANHNTHHSMTQYSSLKTLTPVSFDGKIDIDRMRQLLSKDQRYLTEEEESELGVYLNKTHTFDGERISKNIASVLAAAVDNLKEPVAGGLNLNTFTTDTAMLIMRSGYSMDTAMGLLNQPIVEELTRRAINTSTRRGQVMALFHEMTSELSEAGADTNSLKVDKNGELLPTEFDINSNDLWESIGKDPVEDPQFQLKVLSSFVSYWNAASNLSTMISGSRTDTQNGAIGPSIAHNESKIEATQEVRNDSIPGWRNAHTTLENYQMVNDFFEYGIKRPNDIMKMGLNEDGSIRSLDQDYRGYYIWGLPGMRAVRNRIEEEMSKTQGKGFNIHPNDIDSIQDQFLSYLISDHEFFNISNNEKNRILKEIPNKIAKLKDDNAKITNNPFLSRLHIRDRAENYYTNSTTRVLTLNNAGSMSPSEAELITKGWEYLLNTEEYADLGYDLIRYSFLTNGFEFKANSFGHFIPVSFFEELGRRQGFREHMKRKENELKNFDVFDDNHIMFYEPFIERFIKNNYDDSRLVPKFAQDDESVEILETDKINNKSKTPTRVKAPFTSRFILDKKNGNLFRKSEEDEYIITNKYGVPGVMKEWTEGESYISNNNVKIENISESPTEYNESPVTETQEKLGEETPLGELKMQEDHVQSIIEGSKTVTSRTASYSEKFYKGDGIYTDQRGNRFYVEEITNGEAVSFTWASEEYGGPENLAKAEGFKSLDDMKKNSRKETQNWIKGELDKRVFKVRVYDQGVEERTEEGTEEDNMPSNEILNNRAEPISYTEGQRKALLNVSDFIKSNDNYYLFAGYAGTGKTTLAENIIKHAQDTGYNSQVLAPTNKAARVLTDKLRGNFGKGYELSEPETVHKAVYGEPDDKGVWRPGELKPNTVYLIDEASMIDENMLEDIQENLPKSSKVIFMGDGFQLEPVGKDPNLFKWNRKEFNKKYKSELTDVVRQGKDTVLDVATAMRVTGKPQIPSETNGNFTVEDSRQNIVKKFKESVANGEDSVMIVATNKDKIKYNKLAREAKYGEESTFPLNKGEPIMGVSNSELIANSEIKTVESKGDLIDSGNNLKVPLYGDKKLDIPIYYIMDTIVDGSRQQVMLIPELNTASLYGPQLAKAYEEGATELADYVFRDVNGKIKWGGPPIVTYGYSSTAHKSQGSQWNKVFIDQSFKSDKWNESRWLYTAITRAEDEVHILPNKDLHEVVDHSKIIEAAEKSTTDSAGTTEIIGSNETRKAINQKLLEMGTSQLDDSIFDNIEEKSGQSIQEILNKYGEERTIGKIIKKYC